VRPGNTSVGSGVVGLVPKIELGPTGAVVSPGEPGFVDTAIELEALGYDTIWLTGGPMAHLGQIADVVRATRSVRVASGIIAVVRFSAHDVASLYTELESEQPGRFVVGLGGAHGPEPVATLNAYLDELDATVPVHRRVLAALGPKMLTLARDRTGGAFPVLVTPSFTSQARSELGDDTTLAVEQLVAVETDAAKAREMVRERVGFLSQLPAYQANFRRMGFTDDEISGLADRLVDELISWGDADTIAARVGAHRRSGADHVAVSVVSGPDEPALEKWRALAKVLIQA
jgi:probable F420-dependent oxidoreductase